MRFLEKLKGGFYKKILKATGLCTACFIFEACYGAPGGDFEPIDESVEFSGWVKDDSTQTGIENISVRIENLASQQTIKAFTDRYGKYALTLPAFSNDEIAITFMDLDSAENNLYEDKDTIVTLTESEYRERIKQIDVSLEEK